MENTAAGANKRARQDDSDSDSDCDSDSDSNSNSNSDCDSDSVESKRIRVDSDELASLNSPEAKRLQDDLLLGILDDSDAGDPAALGLDSVIRSFEEEIHVPQSHAVQDLASVSGPGPGLGYLLEASDDELGLPPADGASGEDNKIQPADLEANCSNFFGNGCEAVGFDDEIPSYDCFEFGMGSELGSASEFLMLDGLFDYSDQRYEPPDFSDVSWQQESLPAV